MDTSNNKLIETYKIVRNSVEHFDKILGVFRQIIFAFNGIFISSASAFYLNYLVKQGDVVSLGQKVDTAMIVEANEKMYAMLFAANIVLISVNILVWLLEKHYHRYLLTSALVAENLEKELFPEDNKKHLTYQLRRAYQFKFPVVWYVSFFIRTYDLLYLLPIGGSVFVSNFLLNRSYVIKEFPVLAGYFKSLPIFYSLVCVALIILNWNFGKKFNLSENNEGIKDASKNSLAR